MGSTSIKARKVAVIETKKGPFYALFESTYESNVFPQTPTWGCRYFGTIAGCMDRIIRDGAVAEGGMLKEAAGHVTPSAYIKHWREAFATPTQLEVNKVTGRLGTRFHDVKPDHHEAVGEVLATHGVSVDDQQSFVIDLMEAPEAMQSILDKHLAPAWYFFDGHDWSSHDRSDLGYVTPRAAAYLKTLPVKIYFIQARNEEREHWILWPNGEVTRMGWAYSTIEILINEFATESERQRPGSAENMIRVIRQAVKEAITFDDGQKVTISSTEATSNWLKRLYKELANKLGLEGEEITTTLGQIRQADAVYQFKHLSLGMVRFHGLTESAPVPTVQQDLLAA